jgi:serpin B
VARLFTVVPALIVLAITPALADPRPRDLARLAGASNAIGLEAYGRLRVQPGNLVLAPWALTAALAATRAGARGRTAEQLDEVLDFPAKSLDAVARGLREALAAARGPETTLLTANALWVQETFQILPDLPVMLSDVYDARLEPVNFGKDPAGAMKRINDWTLEHTGGLIPAMLERDDVSVQTRLVLTSAVAFRGAWRLPGPLETAEDAFRLSEVKFVRLPFIRLSAGTGLRYVEDEEIQGLELPYASEQLSVMLLLPRRIDGLAALEAGLTAKRLQRYQARLKERPVRLELPRLRVASAVQLSDALRAMGVKNAFDPAAELGGISRDSTNLYLSRAVQRGLLEVTASVSGEGAPGEGAGGGLLFRADHPFLLVVSDRSTSALLLLARVADPTGR